MKTELIIPKKLGVWARENERVGRLMGSDYGGLLSEAYAALDTGILYQSPIHGIGHIERTMLLGAMIAQAQSLTRHETKMLLLCCSYHDIGRSNDFRDDAHGFIAAKRIAGPEMRRKFNGYSREDMTVMQAAITLHSINDERLDEVARRYGLEGKQRERYCRVARCLKDADNLDRVRLGDLDAGHLRHAESVATVPDAEWIFRRYGK